MKFFHYWSPFLWNNRYPNHELSDKNLKNYFSFAEKDQKGSKIYSWRRISSTCVQGGRQSSRTRTTLHGETCLTQLSSSHSLQTSIVPICFSFFIFLLIFVGEIKMPPYFRSCRWFQIDRRSRHRLSSESHRSRSTFISYSSKCRPAIGEYIRLERSSVTRWVAGILTVFNSTIFGQFLNQSRRV